jgi:hypothetical protein
VDQFKDNKFNRNFFAADMLKSNASYHKYILDQVQNRLVNANFGIQKDTVYDPSVSFDLIRAEIKNLSDQGVIEPFSDMDKLNPGQFDQKVYKGIIDYLVGEKKKLTVITREALDRRDNIGTVLKEDLGGKDALLKLRDDYYNIGLADLLQNAHMFESAIEIDNRLVRKKDLIYMEPASRYGRAHFYAPVKKLGELSIDTYLFNFIFIWVTSFLFYLTLVFDLIRKLVNWAEKIKLRKK